MAAAENMALTTYEAPVTGLVRPLTDAATARQAIQEYEALKAAIVQPSDIQPIQGRDFLKKSFWRRVATCFGLSLELVREERIDLDGKLAYRVMYRAVAPNGRSMDGDGMCVQGEKGQMIEHNIRAIAHTRAKNRAISDLVGGGEVSAEEMPDFVDADPPARPQAARRTVTPAQPAAQKPHDAQAYARETAQAGREIAKKIPMGPKPPKWSDLRTRWDALLPEPMTDEVWADELCQLTGKNDGKALTGEDYRKVEGYVALQEQDARKVKATAAREDPDALRHLDPAAHGVH